MPAACPTCNSSKIKTQGLGTERIEDELKLMVPDLRVQRMDLDTTRSKHGYQKIINDFEQENIDVLVGTQMVKNTFIIIQHQQKYQQDMMEKF